MQAHAAEIFLCVEAGVRPRAVEAARAVPGRGLEGDRYFAGRGTWSYERLLWSDLTLVESEALAAATADGLDLAPGEARRNVVTAGADLDSLIGRRFRLGEVELLGERRCDPCRHLDRLTGQPARSALAGRGGLRAQILTSGVLRVGDPLVVIGSGPPPTGEVATDEVPPTGEVVSGRCRRKDRISGWALAVDQPPRGG